MSMYPSTIGGGRSNVYDPYSENQWDPNANRGGGFSVLRGADLIKETFVSTARIDWRETPEAHVFKVDVPGLKKEEVKVEVEEGKVLQMSGERIREKEEKDEICHRIERTTGKFLRRFPLPENTMVDQIKACMENGVLTVTVPKEQEEKKKKKPEMKTIDISG